MRTPDMMMGCRLQAKQSVQGATDVVGAAEWRTLAALLAQMLGAYLTTLQGAAHHAVSAACNHLWAIAGSTALADDGCARLVAMCS